jgi:hypothetical protein
VAEAPAGGGVVHTRRLLRTVVGPEPDALAAGCELRHRGVVRVPADAAEPVGPIGWLRRRGGMASAVELQAARPKRTVGRVAGAVGEDSAWGLDVRAKIGIPRALPHAVYMQHGGRDFDACGTEYRARFSHI